MNKQVDRWKGKPEPKEDSFKTTGAYLRSLVNYRRAEIEKKTKKMTFNRRIDSVYQHGTEWIEGRIKSFEEKKGVQYFVRLYLQPTDDSILIGRTFTLFEVECIRVDEDGMKVCPGFLSKTRYVLDRPTIKRPNSVCIHALALSAFVCDRFKMGEVIAA